MLLNFLKQHLAVCMPKNIISREQTKATLYNFIKHGQNERGWGTNLILITRHYTKKRGN